MKKIEVKTEKVLFRGVQSRKILKVSAAMFDELPKEYIELAPYAWYRPVDNSIMMSTGNFIFEGQSLEEKEFREVLSFLKEAGNHLREVNMRLKKQNENWKGEETFII